MNNQDNEELKNVKKQKDEKEGVWSYVSVILLAIIIAVFVRTFVFSSNLVKGESMHPTFEENDRLISLKFPLYFSDPKQGDVVIIDAPEEKGKEYIKRIIATPGEEVSIHDGKIFINNKEYKESYIPDNIPTGIYNENSWTLGPDEYFVVGDNRNPGASMDSRYFGPIKRDTIRGIVKLRFWPMNKFGIIGGNNDW